jgi:hypothetical protein
VVEVQDVVEQLRRRERSLVASVTGAHVAIEVRTVRASLMTKRLTAAVDDAEIALDGR